MSLQICWRSNVSGAKNQLIVPFLNAELVLMMVDDVIVDTTWQISHGTQLQKHSKLTKQIQDFLLNPILHHLDVQLLRQGTVYSQKIWQALVNIPFGQVNSYSSLASQMGSGPRAVAQACRSNPYPGIIPCHRVVAKTGLGGFMGQTKGPFVELKRQLLDYETRMAATKS